MLYNSIQLNTFETILPHFYFNDNILNDNYKLRPIIMHLNKRFREHGGLKKHISIDESMIPTMGSIIQSSISKVNLYICL